MSDIHDPNDGEGNSGGCFLLLGLICVIILLILYSSI